MLNEGERQTGSLVECEDKKWEKRDRFDYGLGLMNLGGELNNTDIAIVGPDRFVCGPEIRIFQSKKKKKFTFRFRR